MGKSKRHHKSKFIWQGVWILLPVALLAAVSLISLRRDEAAAEQEARTRATQNVQSLARAILASANEELARFFSLQTAWLNGLSTAAREDIPTVFPDAALKQSLEKWERDYPELRLANLAVPTAEILSDGRRISPPKVTAAPVPPAWFQELSSEQRKLWEALSSSPSQATREAFLAARPSEPARQAALMLFLSPNQIIHDTLPVATESGISFQDLAWLQLLSAANSKAIDPSGQITNGWFSALRHQVMDNPSWVSPRLLELAQGVTNQMTPENREKFLWAQLLCQSQSRVNASLWTLGPLLGSGRQLSRWTVDGAGLALLMPMEFTNISAIHSPERGYDILFVPRAVITAIFERALGENKFLVPSYARGAITVEGMPIPLSENVSTNDEKLLLGNSEQKAAAFSTGNTDGRGLLSFDVKLYLTSREQLLSVEHQREKLFAGLILGAVFAALAGLLAARRAFYRQLQLNDLKSNFISSVSHELRAPIAAVRLMAENLEHGKIPEACRQNEYFCFIVQECRRLSALIENVLDFSRIEQGRKQYDFEPSDVVALIGATVKLMEPCAAAEEVQLRLEPSVPALELKVDGRALQQALVNLIDNAIKHSPKGQSVTVGIETSGATALICVADHGPGIPREEHAKIFERFYRLGTELRRETQGVGIGLSVVKHIVEAHGGRILVQSEPGHGSRFIIELPASCHAS